MRDRESVLGLGLTAGAVGLALCVAFAAAAPSSTSATEPAQAATTSDDEEPPDHPYHRPGRVDALYTLSCWGCHTTIAEEWATTAHGLAWVDERYQKELETRRRPQSCWGCHIPEPLHLAERLGGKPTPRTEETEALHFGVSCKTCHLGPDGEMLGPFGEEQSAHASKRSPSFVGVGSNALCIGCHRTTIGPVIGIAKDFETANLGGQGKSCVECHMPEVSRSMATDDDDEPTQVRKGRSHVLNHPYDPEFLAGGFELTAAIGASSAVLTIENLAGHRIPGLLGREIVFRAVLLDPAGATVSQAECVLDTTSYLPVGEALDLEVEGSGVKLRVTGEHRYPDDAGKATFLELDLE